MFCTNCGNEAEAHARFCSKCGREVTPAVAAAPPPAASSTGAQHKREHDMSMHVNILGWIFVGCGVLFGLLGMTMIFAGQIVQHFPIAWPAQFPFRFVHFAGWLSAIIGL